jgi:non-specific serine/threonine protein kinase
MPEESESEILRLAMKVADGRAVDWPLHESLDPGAAADMEGLRAIEAVAAAMRREIEPISAARRPWLESGRRLGRFRVEAEAGRGGMGIVYRARDEMLDRLVALKLLPPDVAHSAERLAQFTREAKLLASMNHPNIATIHGMEDEGPGLRYLVLEWVPGETLAQRLRRGRLPLAAALDACVQIAQALGAAHEGGVVHRDLKPGNVMITPQGRVKVLDFGLARAETTGTRESPSSEPRIAGTWGYVSPECLERREDHRADVFAFGCLLYECLAGAPAFPGSSVEEIQQALLHREPDASLLPGDTPSTIVELITRCVEKDPERRLTSIADAERILERVLGRAPAVTLAPAAGGTLPHFGSSFVGRGREIEQCRDLLQGCRLLTLTGAGGSGKTRLAVAVAESVGDTFGERTHFVDLTAVRSDARVVDVVAKSLGVREDPSAPLIERIAARLKTDRALLILDNCEHVLSACAEITGVLISNCPGVTFLATSREPLRVPGERVIPVDPLQIPDAGVLADPDAVSQCEAVRLFLDRASHADPTFVPEPRTLRSVGEICRRVAGLPLAVELAAARVRVMSPEEIAERLDRQLQFLRDAHAPITDRHRGIHAAIEWSVQQLIPEEARVFRALAVFAGGWDLEGATRVCSDGGDEFATIDLLSRLVEKSLVSVERRIGEGSRYRFLEPVRQFALGSLAASHEEARARALHLAYFLDLAERAGPELFRQGQRRWLHRLDAEHENLLAALEECEGAPNGAEAAMRIAVSLHRYWYLRGYYREGEVALDRALARVNPSTPEILHARVLLARGSLFLSLGRSTAAPGAKDDPGALRRIFSDALERFRGLGDRRGAASCLNGIGLEHNLHGEFAAGRAALEEACEEFRAMGDVSGVAGASNNIGLAAWFQRDLATARRTITESYELLRGKGDRNFETIMSVNLAFLCVRQDDLDEGRAHLIQALRLVRELGIRTDSATGALLCAGELAVREGQEHATRAANLFGAAQAVLDGLPAAVTGDQPYWHEHDACIARLRAWLGGESFDSAFEAGRRRPTAQALDEALEFALQLR